MKHTISEINKKYEVYIGRVDGKGNASFKDRVLVE